MSVLSLSQRDATFFEDIFPMRDMPSMSKEYDPIAEPETPCGV